MLFYVSVLLGHPCHFLLFYMGFYPKHLPHPNGLEDNHPPTFILLIGIFSFKRNVKPLISSV